MKAPALLSALSLLSAARHGTDAFEVVSPSTQPRRNPSRLNYIDAIQDVAPLSTASFIQTASPVLPQAPPQQQKQQQTREILSEPKSYELPAHNEECSVSDEFYVSNDCRPSNGFADAEMYVGRVSMCLALVLFGTELATGHSLPELVLSALASNS